jgi:uncharacterized membrane protein YfcA
MVLLWVCVFAAAIVASMMGQGGGVLYAPIQVWLGIEFHQAAATSLFLMVVMSLSAAPVYRKAGRIDWPLALTLESTTTVGAFLGGVLSAWISTTALSILLSTLLFVGASQMVRPVYPHDHASTAGRFAWKRFSDGRDYSINLAVAIPLSFGIGIASGLIGIGGGVLKVPAMVLILGVPMKVAVGSSSLMVGVTAAAGLIGHLLHGHLDWRLSVILAFAVFVGGQIGSRLSLRLNTSRLRRVFGGFLLLVAAGTLIKTFV